MTVNLFVLKKIPPFSRLNKISRTIGLGSSLLFTGALLAPLPASAVNFQKLADFNGANGSDSPSSIIQAPNGLFYGTTREGGANNLGVVYSFDLITEKLTNLNSFNGVNGANPFGSLSLAGNGLLYGTAANGGDFSLGTIFSVNPATGIVRTVASFDKGIFPTFGPLLEASNGLLYGTTESGGNTIWGTVYAFDPTNDRLTTVHSFRKSDGAAPGSTLTPGGDGLLYGMTNLGGTNNLGTIYSFNPVGDTLTTLFSFNGTDGRNPASNLTLFNDGLFYGTTILGGEHRLGTLFSFNPTTRELMTLVDFDGVNGALPYSTLTAGANGLLYGTTPYGGSRNLGTIFSFEPTAKVFNTLVDFNGSDGARPFAGPTLGRGGIFYGTTTKGGTSDFGTIYSFSDGSTDSIPDSDPVPVPEPRSITFSIAIALLAAARIFKRGFGR